MQGSNSYQLPISTIRTSHFYLDTKPADHPIFQWKDSILQKIPKVWSLRHKKILWNEDTCFLSEFTSILWRFDVTTVQRLKVRQLMVEEDARKSRPRSTPSSDYNDIRS